MTGAELTAQYFSPLNYALYLLIVLVTMVVYYQWKWTKISRGYVLVLVVKSDGHGDYQLAKQQGGSVTLKAAHSETRRLWPINELCTVVVPYPGLGFIPGFLQKTIKQVIVDEKDWEPLLNRSAYNEGVASPDVVELLKRVAEEAGDTSTQQRLLQIANGLATAPTRAMIANPAVLGNLIMEKITEAVLTINKDVLDSLTSLSRRLGKSISPNMFYMGIGVLAIGIVFIGYQGYQLLSEIMDKLAVIGKSLGVAP